MSENMYFDQCMDFLARMIEKYGDRIEISDEPEHIYEVEVPDMRKSA